MEKAVQQLYGDRIRLRTCGICIKDDSILLVNHHNLTVGDFWAPPGGGIEFGESAEEGLAREFLEETGLVIKVEEFLFVGEFISLPLHAVELFFLVEVTGGALKLGSDPESGNDQLIQEVRFVPFGEVENLQEGHVHGIFKTCPDIRQINLLRGHFKV